MSFFRICLYCSLAVLAASVPAFRHNDDAPPRGVQPLQNRASDFHPFPPALTIVCTASKLLSRNGLLQIQQALIREHYLTGDANGEWNVTTQAAMQKYQADHGWQTRLLPDSRALKALGLGPDYSTAINAKDVAANNGSAGQAPAVPAAQAAGFAAASGVNR